MERLPSKGRLSNADRCEITPPGSRCLPVAQDDRIWRAVYVGRVDARVQSLEYAPARQPARAPGGRRIGLGDPGDTSSIVGLRNARLRSPPRPTFAHHQSRSIKAAASAFKVPTPWFTMSLQYEYCSRLAAQIECFTVGLWCSSNTDIHDVGTQSHQFGAIPVAPGSESRDVIRTEIERAKSAADDVSIIQLKDSRPEPARTIRYVIIARFPDRSLIFGLNSGNYAISSHRPGSDTGRNSCLCVLYLPSCWFPWRWMATRRPSF